MKQGNMIEELEKYFIKYIVMEVILLTAFTPSLYFLRGGGWGETWYSKPERALKANHVNPTVQ